MNTHAYTIDANTCWVRLVGKAANGRVPLHLIACIDTSGSMAEELRLENVKHTLRTAVDFMGGTDKLSLVSFSSDSDVVLKQIGLNDQGSKAHANQYIDESGGEIGATCGVPLIHVVLGVSLRTLVI
jgi:secreted protein with Ig-like and vWFA domain